MNVRYGHVLLFLLSLLAMSGGAQQRTAQLQIQWTTAVEGVAGNVSLLPVDVDLPSSGRDEAIAAWTRAIRADGQTWEALPPGTYRIVIRAATAAADAAPPVDVGEVLLAPGERRVLAAALPRREIRPRDLPIDIPNADDSLTITQWHNGRPSRLSWSRSATPLVVHTFCAAGDILQFQTEKRIGTAILDGRCQNAISVVMSERIDVAARIDVPAGAVSPSWGTVRCGETDIPYAVVRARIETSVPKGCSELTVRANGFTPVTVPFAKDLGTIALRQSAAVAMRVRSGRSGELLGGVRVTAVRAHDIVAMRSNEEIARHALASTVTDAAGWARLAELREERVVFVLHAAGRKVPQFSEPSGLRVGTETILEDLSLEPPANVIATVSLAKNLEGSVELQDVELSSAERGRWPERLAIRGGITPSGAVIEDVPPGTWKVSASGRLRNGFAIRAAEKTVEVLPGIDAYVALDIHDTLYRGRVTRDGAPVAGVVNLKPIPRGSGRRSAVANAGADGMFLVLLENEGDYSFSLQERSGATVRLDHAVRFADPKDEVDIELPEHHIRGRVVDAAGNAVPGASVSATGELTDPSGMAASRSLPSGEFEIANVSSGTWNVVADTASGRSEPAVVSVSGGDLEGVTLMLDPIRTVHVRLVDVTGAPVRQAFLAVDYPAAGGTQLNSMVKGTNDDGVAVFRVSESEQATPVSLVIVTLDLRLSCYLTRLDTDQTVQLPTSFGQLRLSGRSANSQHPWLISSSGCSVPFLGTRFEPDSNGETSIIFPQLAVGTWTYVETRNPAERAAVITGRGATLQGLKTFTVRAGSVIRVTVPER